MLHVREKQTLWEAPEGPKTTGPCVSEWICKVVRKHVQAGGWDVPSPAATRSLDLPPDGDQTHILLSGNQINPAEAAPPTGYVHKSSGSYTLMFSPFLASERLTEDERLVGSAGSFRGRDSHTSGPICD